MVVVCGFWALGALATAIILAWLLTGPIFHYSDTWQLVINTATTSPRHTDPESRHWQAIATPTPIPIVASLDPARGGRRAPSACVSSSLPSRRED